MYASTKLDLKQSKSTQKSYFIQKILDITHYITYTLTIENRLTMTNKPHKLSRCALHNLLSDNEKLRTNLHFDDPIAVREYVIIQNFWGYNTDPLR